MRATILSPQDFYLLDQWGRQVSEAFDETPYLVGSALGDTRDDYRDVDVRVLCDDPWVLGPLCDDGARPRLRVVNLAVTLWGRQATGLPIDFQFQQSDEFHEYDGQRRSALGLRSRIDSRHLSDLREAATAARGGESDG